ncbi:MAG: XRE family transcriptional regulator, partial [Magnetococcales bacterium]|nr:XRE family transcriptional regulator [Magnetococcales bacterium]
MTRDAPLQLSSLPWKSFEKFCTDLLSYKYRDCGGVANPFGSPGSKQKGIDIRVRGDFGVHSFQCKQVQEFGPQEVHRAVSAHSFISDKKFLLLSRVASPGAREAIAQYPDWQLWDQEDISARFRELPMVDRRNLVDSYFPGQRLSLLGVPESGPFQTPEAFFKGFIEPDRWFHHGWDLVGRTDDLDQLAANLLDDNLLVTILQGAPGSGKTRLLREVVKRVSQQRPEIAVHFVSPTEEVIARHLEELGIGEKLLIVDDAHDRDDLDQLLRYVSVPGNRGRLLLSLRPYGHARVLQQASLVAIDSPWVVTVALQAWTKEDAQRLATQVLQFSGGPLHVASGIAELTYLTPLVTVLLAAQVVAKEELPPAMIGNSQDFQRLILARYEKIITGQIVPDQQDKSKLQAVLRMVALLQPITIDDQSFFDILLKVEKLEYEDIQSLLRLLIEGGVLFRRGLRYRLAPDLLADSIIQSNFFDPNGSVTIKVEKVFDIAEGDYLTHLLVNLGRLDWRLRHGETEGRTLLASISPKLQWHNEYHNPHIEAVEAVAYYQPRLALDFAERLIGQKHANVPGVCNMVRNAVYNLEFLEEGCVLLWRAGKDDARELHRCPHHGIRILQELAKFAPNKPVECVERVVQFAIELLDRPISLRGCYTPFTILEGALGTEMEEITSKSLVVTFTRYSLPFERAKTVRARVIDVIVNALQGDSSRKAFLAAQLLSTALRSPMHSNDVHVWDVAHAELLVRVHKALLDNPAIHPAVLVMAAMSVSCNSFYNRTSDCAPLAQSIIALLDRDLPTRLIRLVADAGGSQTWKDDSSNKREAHKADTVRFIDDLSSEFPEVGSLYAFLEKWLNEINKVTGQKWQTAQIVIKNLLLHRPDLAKKILAKRADESPLSSFAGVALAVLMNGQNRHALISELLEDDSVGSWRLVADAYGIYEGIFIDADISIVRRIFQSVEPAVLYHATFIGRSIVKHNPILALELICLADMTINYEITNYLFGVLACHDTILEESITPEQWRILLQGLSQAHELDDYS